MKTWNDYKEYAKSVDMEAKNDIEEAESLAEIVGAMFNMLQSSLARIESLKTTPNLDTILKLFEPFGLALTVSMKRV